MGSLIQPTPGEMSYMFHGASMGIVSATVVIVIIVFFGRSIK